MAASHIDSPLLLAVRLRTGFYCIWKEENIFQPMLHSVVFPGTNVKKNMCAQLL